MTTFVLFRLGSGVAPAHAEDLSYFPHNEPRFTLMFHGGLLGALSSESNGTFVAVDTGVLYLGDDRLFRLRSQLLGLMTESLARSPGCIVGRCDEGFVPTLGLIDAVSLDYAWHVMARDTHTLSVGIHSHIRVLGGAERHFVFYAIQPGVTWDVRGEHLALVSSLAAGPDLILHRLTDDPGSGELVAGLQVSADSAIFWRLGTSLSVFAEARGGLHLGEGIGVHSFVGLQVGIAGGWWQ